MTKLIRKVYQGQIPKNKVVNTRSNSKLDTYSCNYINNLISMSYDEHVIGICFGKPLYSKTIDCGNLPNNNYKTVAHNISNWEKIFVDFSTSYLVLDNAQFQGVNGAICNTYVNGNDIILNATGDRTAWKAIVTLRYTKTTD